MPEKKFSGAWSLGVGTSISTSSGVGASHSDISGGGGDHWGDSGGVFRDMGTGVDSGRLSGAGVAGASDTSLRAVGGVGAGNCDSGTSGASGCPRLGVWNITALLIGVHVRAVRGGGVFAPRSRSGRTMRHATRDMAVRVNAFTP